MSADQLTPTVGGKDGAVVPDSQVMYEIALRRFYTRVHRLVASPIADAHDAEADVSVVGQESGEDVDYALLLTARLHERVRALVEYESHNLKPAS